MGCVWAVWAVGCVGGGVWGCRYGRWSEPAGFGGERLFARLAISAAVLAKERTATCQSNQHAYMEDDSSFMLGRNIKQFAIRDRQFAIRISLSPNALVSLTGVFFFFRPAI